MSYLKYYEEKFIKFYRKFSLEPGNAKERLEICAEELEYAYSLSQIDELGYRRKELWKQLWNELTCKPPYNENDSIKSSISHSLNGKRHTSLMKYLEFFLDEYDSIISKVTHF